MECLRPGVQNTEDADLGSEVFRITGHFPQCGGAGFEQQVIDHPLVLIRQARNGLRDGEDDMYVTGRQQLTGALGDPPVPGSGLALRTVPIPTRVVGEGAMGTRRIGTPIAVTPKIGGPTPQDRIEDATVAPVADPKVRTMTTDDIGHFDRGPDHLPVRRQRAVSGHRDIP